jgi:peptide/nickel transport system ATP-binding protein
LTQSADQDVLVVKDLRVVFHTYAGEVKALDGVDLTVRRREVLGLVGESGSGKSVTALTIEGLLPQNGEVVSGSILLAGSDLLKESGRELRSSRITDMAMVFQDPTTYLNPVLTVGSQITEIISSEAARFSKEVLADRIRELKRLRSSAPLSPDLEAELARLEALPPGAKVGGREFKRLSKLYAINILRQVRLPEPERIFKDYPFQLSGGMKQRAMIAMALVRRPKLFLADEITTALDVTVQAQILKLLIELREQIDTSVILITHDLAIVAEVCDRVAVMYAGNIVELADVAELFRNPLHPYTKGLLASIPRPDLKEQEMKSIRGSVPNLIFPPSGCRFHPRCDYAFERCPLEKPKLVEVSKGHYVACFLYEGPKK